MCKFFRLDPVSPQVTKQLTPTNSGYPKFLPGLSSAFEMVVFQSGGGARNGAKGKGHGVNIGEGAHRYNYTNPITGGSCIAHAQCNAGLIARYK